MAGQGHTSVDQDLSAGDDAGVTGKGPRPNLFVVGAPRCGTTALHTLLAQHPDIFMSADKEPHYFSKELNRRYEDFQGRRIHRIHRTLAEYLTLFAKAGTANIRGESSVFYLYSDVAKDCIHAFDSRARIVILVRDPVELLRSMHAKLVMMGDEDRTDFREALALEEDRRVGRRLPPNLRVPYLLFYSDYVRLAPRILAWRRRFGTDRVLVLMLDDLRGHPQPTLHRVLDFLNVARVSVPEQSDRNASREPRWPYVNRILTRRRGDGRYRFTGRTAKLIRRLNSRRARHDRVDADIDHDLRRRFRGEVEALAEAIGRDVVKQWGYE